MENNPLDMTQQKETIKALKQYSKNQIIELILSPIVSKIEMGHGLDKSNPFINDLHLILIQNGLDAGCYVKETNTH